MGEIASGILNAVGLNASTFLYCLAAVLAGAYLKGYTGFGASMLWMTSLSLVLPPLQVVPIVLMFEVVTSITLLPQIWRDIRWRSIALLLLGTWAATPIGIHALTKLPAAPIRIALAIVVLIAAILILRGFALSKEPGRPATVGVGLMAGVLNGSMGIVGPPVILFYFSSPIGVVAGRASPCPNMTQPSGIRMSPRLLDEVRDLMRRRHCSIHTERAYRDWARRCVRFHNMQSRDDLRHGEEEAEADCQPRRRSEPPQVLRRLIVMGRIPYRGRRVITPNADEIQVRRIRARSWRARPSQPLRSETGVRT